MGAVDVVNALPVERLQEELRACCAAPAWVATIAAHRPYGDRAELLAVADAAARSLSWDEVRLGLSAHPRIGERAAGDSREAIWSRAEQAAANEADQPAANNAGQLAANNAGQPAANNAGQPAANNNAGQPAAHKGDGGRAELIEVNRAYEERFGHVFLICASGRTRDEIVATARARLNHDEATERAVVTDELRKIALLRLERVLDALG